MGRSIIKPINEYDQWRCPSNLFLAELFQNVPFENGNRMVGLTIVCEIQKHWDIRC